MQTLNKHAEQKMDMPVIEEVATIFAVYTNTDLTEGRGTEYIKYYCWLKATAVRIAYKNYVQGTNCPVKEIKAYKIDGKWSAQVNITLATPADKAQEALFIAEREKEELKRATLKKLTELGLTAEELAALQ